jgi:hypothetical protein
MVNGYDNFFTYIMSYLHFLVSAFIAFILIRSHKNASKETSSYKYVFYPLIIVFTFFYLWGTFGCMGTGMFFFAFISLFIYPLYISYVSNSATNTLWAFAYTLLGLLLLYGVLFSSYK